jgi:hypothetical protein
VERFVFQFPFFFSTRSVFNSRQGCDWIHNLKMVLLQDLGFPVRNGKRKKDGSDSKTDCRPPTTTEKLKMCIVDLLASKIKNTAELPLLQFNLDNNSHEKEGWI